MNSGPEKGSNLDSMMADSSTNSTIDFETMGDSNSKEAGARLSMIILQSSILSINSPSQDAGEDGKDGGGLGIGEDEGPT